MNTRPDTLLAKLQAQPSVLQPYLRAFRFRLRLRDGWLLAQNSLWLAFGATLIILLIGRVFPLERLLLWAWLLPGFIWLVFLISYSFLRPINFSHTARRVDLELGLKERLSTTLELEHANASENANLVAHQQDDALATARSIDTRRSFPFSWQRRPTMFAAGLLAIAVILIWLPNPMDAVLAERDAVEQAAQEQAEKIEEIKQEIEKSTELSPELQAELLRQLEELAQQLRENPGDREKALADLSRLEEDLRRQLDPANEQRQAALEALGSQLQSLAQMENINPSDLELSAEALEQLAEELANMDESERANLAATLAQAAAQAAQSGDTALAQALAAMSQAAQSGDAQAAQDASAQAAEALAQAQGELSDQNALQGALGQLQNASQSIAQAGQLGSQQAQQVAGQQPGAGQNPGQGQSGQGLGGGGTKADVLPPGTSSGQARQPDDQSSGNAGTGELGEQVFIPWERRPDQGEEVSIPGQDTGQGETITRENPNPSGGLPGPALIPYQQVYTQYQQAAQQAIERGEIPPAYRDLVREYFTLLEP